MAAYLFRLLGHRKLDRVRDELRVLQKDGSRNHDRTTTDVGVDSVRCDGEGSTSCGLPDSLLVVELGDDLDVLSDDVRRLKSDTELSNHGDVNTGRERRHETLYTRM